MTSSSNGNGKKSPFDGRAFRRQLMKQGMFVRNPINDKDSLALMDEHGTGYSTVGECLNPCMPSSASLCCSKQLQSFQQLTSCKRPQATGCSLQVLRKQHGAHACQQLLQAAPAGEACAGDPERQGGCVYNTDTRGSCSLAALLAACALLLLAGCCWLLCARLDAAPSCWHGVTLDLGPLNGMPGAALGCWRCPGLPPLGELSSASLCCRFGYNQVPWGASPQQSSVVSVLIWCAWLSCAGLVAQMKDNGNQWQFKGITVKLANAFGYCWGVERAVQMAYEARRAYPGQKLHITNEIIHNPAVNQVMALPVYVLSTVV